MVASPGPHAAPLCAALLVAGPLVGQTPTVTDPRDGRVYPTVTIGGRTWMAENLARDAGSGSRCFADDPASCERFGRLYTWTAALVACPAGWHLPTEGEWRDLESALGMPEDELAAFWTATEERKGETAWHRDLSRDPRVYRSPVDPGYYLSVRCVADPRNAEPRPPV